MSLNSALQIGRSALSASQLGIQVAGNNMANAGTVGYSRQVTNLEALRGDQTTPGGGAGRGVRVTSIRRQVDDAMQARLLGSSADAAAAQTQRRIFEQVESTLGELGDNDLSNELAGFFRVFSERANNTKGNAAVVQQGDKLAGFMRGLRSELIDQRKQIDQQVSGAVAQANQLLSSIAKLNTAISSSEGTGTPANTLRDERDRAVASLSEIMEVSVIDRGLGGVDVLVGSAPILLGENAKRLEARTVSVDGTASVKVYTAGDRGEELNISGGEIGSLLLNRGGALDATVARLDTLASQLIFEMNKVHATATNAAGLTRTSSALSIGTADRSLPMNDAANETFAGLPFTPVNGGFVVNIRQQATGAVQSVRLNIDLDGITATGMVGTDDDTTPEDLRAALDALDGLSATFSAEGKLQLTAANGFDFSFSDDSSGVLGALGVNAYFAGLDATDIAVRADLRSDPSKLSAGRIVNGQFIDNAAMLAMTNVQQAGLTVLGGVSITEHWRDTSAQVSGGTAAAKGNAAARELVHEGLLSQRDALSGVNIDEESISLMDFQRQYQAAARVISTVDQMTQTLFSIL
jgi:flagellar hook-associated protein 1 FlgK